MKTFQAMAKAGQPIIGGGAGTGLSAKWEEAGGIDLIVIYNSGRYRMAGRGSLAGMMAYGNANDIVVEMAREVLPVVKETPVLAGVNGTPEDASYILQNCSDCHGFYGASSMERLPTEKALVEQTRQFKAITRGPARKAVRSRGRLA